MYDLIKAQFLNGEMSDDEVVQRARSGILSFKEAEQIITLKRKGKQTAVKLSDTSTISAM